MSGLVTGAAVVKARPSRLFSTGTTSPRWLSAPWPTASSTVSESVPGMGTAITARAAPVISRARSAMSIRAVPRSLPDISSWVISALACSQRSRRRDSS